MTTARASFLTLSLSLAAACSTPTTAVRKPADLVHPPAEHTTITAAAEKLREAYNAFRMELLDAKSKLATRKALKAAVAAYRGELGAVPLDQLGPAWAREAFEVSRGETVEIASAWSNLQAAWTADRVPTRSELALDFAATSDNQTEVLAGRDKFWPDLMKEIEKARSSIHVHIFGMQWDKWGKEFGEVVARKAKDGVRVRIIADKIGARMKKGVGFGGAFHPFHPPGEEMFNFYQANGVEYAFYASELLDEGPFRADHRKYFIIDGEVAYNTGFTLEEHMRYHEFDVAVKARGSLVKQLQASWLLNWRKLGGKLETKDWAELEQRYFPEQKEPAGKQTVKLALNVPWQEHRITEHQFEAIRNAKRRVYVLDPYPIDDTFTLLLAKAAAREGVEVRVVTPAAPENPLNSAIMSCLNPTLRKAKIDTRLYQAPDKIGKSHAKVLLVDDWVSLGSCNRDTMALRTNYEQNLESSDPEVVEQVRREVFEHVFQYSMDHEVEPAQGWAKIFSEKKCLKRLRKFF